MVATIQIGHLRIGSDQPPFIIAEMSGNHGQSLEKAMALVDAAATAGAHALKLQTYTPDTITLNVHEGEFFIEDKNSLWQGNSLYNLYQQAMTPWEWHQPIFDYATSKGMLAFSSPFDLTAVDFLESLNVPCYKIASFENSDHALLAAVAQTGKPVIMSTGMATQAELAESVEVLRGNGCSELILLKCTSNYPARPVDANLRTIPHLAELFNCQVGLSDHTPGVGVSVAAVALGATVVEKHFVLDRSGGEVDAEFSLEPNELKMLVEETARAHDALGRVHYGCTEKEIASRLHRRSLYIAKDMKAGDVFTTENLRSVRPGLGLAPKYLSQFLGRKVKQDVATGTPLNWEML
ncbi:pseudaminic acid synthase [Alkalimonas collagenimarina]|uniref:Pseudaminic acid synthase n=1 Tax=Alkalimonas collagenimarina TaxID=400390 RepID=A0ABT9GXV5_9GAMM|nr:pseudaminic acid synthase [Alkalimonas collagenimarina]MDP4535896.1 pseudaminic acid synthase [Alkalimonas collagenimarina]